MLLLLLACAHHPASTDQPQTVPAPALMEFQRWCSDVRARVYAHLTPPPDALAHPEVETWVDVVVQADGAISEATVSRTSGYPAIDDAVLAAVKAAGPLPKPPAADREVLAEGVTFKVRATPAS